MVEQNPNPIRRILKAAASSAIVVALFLLVMFCITPGPRLPKPEIVVVKSGDSLGKIAEKLKRANIVRSRWLTVVYGRLMGLETRVKFGVYAFFGDERIDQVLRHLTRGDSLAIVLVVPEGFTVWQIAERLESLGVVCADDFVKAAFHGPVVRALHMEPTGVEGYLFPATYYFAPGTSSDEIILTMLARFYTILTREIEEREFALGITTHQMVTLASLVEKEAKLPQERAIIAGVFYNRLRLGMPLQSDPSAQYSPDYIVRPVQEAVHTPSAFNTYYFVGLPPGPIANPGLSAIKAVLYPARTDYLYFVARRDGSHIFSRSLAEHERAIAALRSPPVNPFAKTSFERLPKKGRK